MMRYRKYHVDRAKLDALLRELAPDLPPDARVARAVVTLHGGLTLTVYSERFELIALVRPGPRLD